ncbi:unnamed protein product [Brachionus calyciflorus]|uniref:Uncharacterized protein n=1 Tax=Brachionus calyciflorus TaxID=104777 RepID=A0A813WFP2_9BILA|nr:unnamed protein product [Brachionus calyciflorus]
MLISFVNRCFMILTIWFFFNVDCTDFLKKIDIPCTRQCESHFSDAACWEKSFKYFSNHLIQSLVDFGNANYNTKNESVELTDNAKQVYKKYRDDTTRGKKSNSEFVNKIVIQMDQIFEEVVNNIGSTSLNLTSLNLTRMEMKCPEKCSADSLTVWKSLFGALAGLTSVSIIFTGAYILFSKFQYNALKKNYS